MEIRTMLTSVLAVATAFPPVFGDAVTILPLGDSLTEGLCTNGVRGNGANATCTDPYDAHNRAIFDRFRSVPSFCGEFAQHLVEDYNHGATGGYRGPLLQQLRDAGLAADFVGSVHSGNALAPADDAHDGHSGWNVEQLDYCAGGYAAHDGLPAFDGYVAAARPDIVLLLVGTNDLLNGAAAEPLADQVVGMLHRIEAAAPQARVLVGLPPKRYLQAPDERFEGVRAEFASRLAAATGKDFPCTARDLPDMSILTQGDMTWGPAALGVHPDGFGYLKMARIWAGALAAPECRFDTRAFIDVGGTLVESITAYGRYWNYDAVTMKLLSNGALAAPDAQRYSTLCSGRTVCTFDTRSMTGTAAAPVESITAFDNYYDIALDGRVVASGPLASVARYQPICALSSEPGHCVFDTRTLSEHDGTRVESITAYGHWFDFDVATQAPLGSGTLASVHRYAPICASMPATDATCRFDTRAFVRLAQDWPLFESITAYGHYWNFDDHGQLVGDGSLGTVPRYHPDAAARQP